MLSVKGLTLTSTRKFIEERKDAGDRRKDQQLKKANRKEILVDIILIPFSYHRIINEKFQRRS